MSRTLRKQSGNRYWRDKHRSVWNFYMHNYRYSRILGKYWHMDGEAIPMSFEEIEAEMQEDILNHEKKDGKWDTTGLKSRIKWHSNMMVRQGNRKELHRVMRDPENYDYNPDHDIRKKGIIWIYD